jgi:hypothetical protein
MSKETKTYSKYVKSHWRLNNRRVRVSIQGRVYRLMIFWNNKLGLIHPIKLNDLEQALRIASKIEAKNLIDTTIWTKIWQPNQYKGWNQSYVYCD